MNLNNPHGISSFWSSCFVYVISCGFVSRHSAGLLPMVLMVLMLMLRPSLATSAVNARGRRASSTINLQIVHSQAYIPAAQTRMLLGVGAFALYALYTLHFSRACSAAFITDSFYAISPTFDPKLVPFRRLVCRPKSCHCLIIPIEYTSESDNAAPASQYLIAPTTTPSVK